MTEIKYLWCVFSYNHKELAAYHTEVMFAGELETKELLAAVNGVPAWANERIPD